MKPWEMLTQISCLLRGALKDATAELEALGLSPRSFLLLSKIDSFPYPAQLAQELFVPPPTITQIVRQLENAKIVKRTLDAKDLRRYRLTLTGAGQQALARGKSIVNRSMGKRLSKYSKSELRVLGQLLSRQEPSQR